MNERIHNEEVASFKEKVKSHENAIIEGKKMAHDLNEFIDLHGELIGIQEEYFELAQRNDDPKYIEELEDYLREELDYLDLINCLFNDLENYHDTVGLVDSNMIINEWEDVRIMVTYYNVQSSLNRVESLIEAHPEEKQYADLYKELKRQYKKLEKKVVEAQHHMIDKTDTKVNSAEIDSKEIEANLAVNQEAYNNMNSSEKIDYLEKIMVNIEKARGKKRTLIVNGERINISKKYADRYLKYNAMLNNLYLQKEQEEQELEEIARNIEIQTEAIIYPEYLEEYWELRDEMFEIDRAYEAMLIRASSAESGSLAQVTLPNGNSVGILESDLEAFENLSEKARNNEVNFEEVMIIYGAPAIDGMTESEKIDSIWDEIEFLQANGVEGEELKAQINDLVATYYKNEKRKKMVTISNLSYMFRKLGWSKKEATEMAKIAYNPEKYQKDKNVSNQEKSSKFSAIFKSITAAVASKEENNEKDVNKMPLKDRAEMGAYKHVFGAAGYMGGVALDIKDFATKALKAVKSMPKKGSEYISKITENRKPVNKAALKEKIVKRGLQVGAVLGMVVLMHAAAKSGSKNDALIVDLDNNNKLNNETNIEQSTEVKQDDYDKLIDEIEKEAEAMGDKIYDEVNKEDINKDQGKVETDGIMSDEQEVVNSNEIKIGGIFTTDENAPIYTNMYDAAQETNGKNAYFEANSNREITAIVYEYNGSKILLDMNDPEYEAKKTALETNGAVAVAVRSQNEQSQDLNNYEGYYNIDDISMGGRK